MVLPPVKDQPSFDKRLFFIVPAVILLLASIGFAIYWFNRETTLNVAIDPGPRTLTPEARIVLNYSGKLEILRQDYLRRRTPLEKEIERIKSDLSAANADLAGRDQRKKLLQDALEQYKSEIPAFLTESQSALDSLWGDESEALNKEYDDFKQSLHNQIEQRAAELGVAYQRNTEIDAIAVAVNAFRLALYGVGISGKINVSEQRSWAEDILNQWDSYEQTWRQKQLEIKKKALEIKKQPLPKIAETRNRIENLERDIEAIDIDLNSLKNEVARHEANLADASKRLADIDPPFYEELRRIPDEFAVMSLPVVNGTIVLGDLQNNPTLAQGLHFLHVTATEAGQEFWAVQEIEILPFRNNHVRVEASRFVDLKTILNEALFSKP